MIAYNNLWLYNLYVQKQADEALQEQCITAEMYNATIGRKEVKFYSPNFFVRIGLGLLTFIIVAFVLALWLLMFHGDSDFSLHFFFTGTLCYIVAEILIRKKAHYNSGVDNMLVWTACLFVCIGFWFVIDNPISSHGYEKITNPDIKLSFAVFIICSAFAIRFADVIMSIAATIAFLCFIFYSYQHTGVLAKATTPFVMILISGMLYFVSDLGIKLRSMLLYRYCTKSVNVVALVALYASGNYYLVRELSNEMFHLHLSPYDPLPMGWFFWLWTFILPLAYIGIGIRKKNIILIRTALPLIAAAVLTFRYYHSILSLEMAMMLGGALLIVISYLLIQYLHTPKGGFTFQPEKYTSNTPDIGKLLAGELIDNSATVANTKGNDTW